MARRALGPIGVRLALAFVVVAIAAVGVLAALTLVGTRSEVAGLVRRQHAERASAVAAAAAFAYEDAGTWAAADLAPAAALAAAAGADLEVRDAGGRLLAVAGSPHQQMMSGLMGRMMGDGMMGTARAPLGEALTRPVVARGTTVGEVSIRFPVDLPGAERQVRDALVRTVAAGAGLAALVALGVAVFVSRRITRPLVALTERAQAIEAGDRRARAALAPAPGELGELGVAFDRMADGLARQDALRRALVADVAHELRTPVTVLQAECEALVDGIATPSPERLVSLHDEVLRLGRLVEDLETLSSAEAAGLRLDRRPVDLAEVATDAVRSLEHRARDAGLSLTTTLRPVTLDGDPARLHQVAVNLLANALKYTPAGGTVSLSVGPDGSFARLEVADTGPGIPDDELPHVFERFWRGRDAETTSGSGIGLAVVAELVRAHKGQVTAANRPGGGARFTVVLPRP